MRSVSPHRIFLRAILALWVLTRAGQSNGLLLRSMARPSLRLHGGGKGSSTVKEDLEELVMNAVEKRTPLLLSKGVYRGQELIVLEGMSRLILASSAGLRWAQVGRAELWGQWLFEEPSHGVMCDGTLLRFRAEGKDARCEACVEACGGPWVFENVTVSCAGGIALCCSEHARVKSTRSDFGGLSDEAGERAYVAVELNEVASGHFLRCSVGNTTGSPAWFAELPAREDGGGDEHEKILAKRFYGAAGTGIRVVDFAVGNFEQCMVRHCGIGIDVQGSVTIVFTQSVLTHCGAGLLNAGNKSVSEYATLDLSHSKLYGKDVYIGERPGNLAVARFTEEALTNTTFYPYTMGSGNDDKIDSKRRHFDDPDADIMQQMIRRYGDEMEDDDSAGDGTTDSDGGGTGGSTSGSASEHVPSARERKDRRAKGKEQQGQPRTSAQKGAAPGVEMRRDEGSDMEDSMAW